ncbi:unnamed protein product, partial [Urochloa humidicola]
FFHGQLDTELRSLSETPTQLNSGVAINTTTTGTHPPACSLLLYLRTGPTSLLRRLSRLRYLLPPSARLCTAQAGRARPDMVMMGQLGRLVDGIKSRLRHGGGNGKRGKAAASSASSPMAAGYDKVEKTDSMRVEIRSRQARKLIAKNLDAADSIARAGRANKRFFLAF